MKHFLLSCLTAVFLQAIVVAQTTVPTEEDYYPLARFTIPKGIVLEVGAIEPLPDESLAVSTRRGDIYRVKNPLDEDPTKATYELFAQGLHEVLGLTYKDGWLYATQRGEVTRHARYATMTAWPMTSKPSATTGTSTATTTSTPSAHRSTRTATSGSCSA